MERAYRDRQTHHMISLMGMAHVDSYTAEWTQKQTKVERLRQERDRDRDRDREREREREGGRGVCLFDRAVLCL